MDELFRVLFDPSTSLIGRIVTLAVLGAIGVFVFMARSSMHSSANSEREDHEADRRAEAIVRQVRREMAERNEPGS